MRAVGRPGRGLPWSSARARLADGDDGVVRVPPLMDRVAGWSGFLADGRSEAEHEAIRAGERTGRPLGSAEFVAELEQRLGRVLARRKPGPTPKAEPA